MSKKVKRRNITEVLHRFHTLRKFLLEEDDQELKKKYES